MINGTLQDRCDPCPIGANCDQSNTTIVNVRPYPAYYPELGQSNSWFIKCPNPLACVGGASICAPNYRGTLCTKCASGMFLDQNFECSPCPTRTFNALRFFGVIIGVLVFCAASIYVAIPRDPKKQAIHSIILKIIYSAFQFNSLASNFDFQWPDGIADVLAAQKSASYVGDSVLSLDCLLSSDPTSATPSVFFFKTMFIAAIPPLCVIVPLIFLVPWGFYLILIKNADRDPTVLQDSVLRFSLATFHGQTSSMSSGSNPSLWQRVWTLVKDTYRTSVIVTFFLVHPSITRQTFLLLSCKKVGLRGDDYYLTSDFGVQCWSQGHLLWVFFLAFPMFFLYVVGIPLLAIYVLKRSSHKLDEFRVMYKYAFLYRGYGEKWYFWEVVVILRKVLLVLISVFFSSDIKLQSSLALLLVTLCLMLQLFANPFVLPILNYLELSFLWTAFLTFFLGQYLFDNSLSRDSRILVSVILVGTNIFFFFGGFFLFLVYVRRFVTQATWFQDFMKRYLPSLAAPPVPVNPAPPHPSHIPPNLGFTPHPLATTSAFDTHAPNRTARVISLFGADIEMNMEPEVAAAIELTEKKYEPVPSETPRPDLDAVPSLPPQNPSLSHFAQDSTKDNNVLPSSAFRADDYSGN
eukprot:TRINITY_DN17119_c0_g1_i5.p1 TRINITY_DN17119_c0_g1~~TRINITY_DN17119_c0_g1_i5.p1  ORF type:complete len:634 (+),score=97.92 TRINITY_DN17119_c0_g1_i5:441-2342(+)